MNEVFINKALLINEGSNEDLGETVGGWLGGLLLTTAYF
jgi:hypothetical protein